MKSSSHEIRFVELVKFKPGVLKQNLYIYKRTLLMFPGFKEKILALVERFFLIVQIEIDVLTKFPRYTCKVQPTKENCDGFIYKYQVFPPKIYIFYGI